MPYNPSNFHQSQRGNLDYLHEALGIRELFERVAELDGGEGPMDSVEENPTNNPAVIPNMEGVGTYSGGPNSENDGSLATLDPDYIEKVKKEAEDAKAKADDKESDKAKSEEKEKTTSTSTSSRAKSSSSSTSTSK